MIRSCIATVFFYRTSLTSVSRPRRERPVHRCPGQVAMGSTAGQGGYGWGATPLARPESESGRRCNAVDGGRLLLAACLNGDHIRKTEASWALFSFRFSFNLASMLVLQTHGRAGQQMSANKGLRWNRHRSIRSLRRQGESGEETWTHVRSHTHTHTTVSYPTSFFPWALRLRNQVPKTQRNTTSSASSHAPCSLLLLHRKQCSFPVARRPLPSCHSTGIPMPLLVWQREMLCLSVVTWHRCGL